MKKSIIHLSDLHFRTNWEEDQELVLDAFFKDLSKQITRMEISDTFLIFSGDIVLKGENPEFYESFLKEFDTKLNQLNIPKSQRICVPGNHDLSQEFVKKNFLEHENYVSQKLNEKDFNDCISQKPKLLIDKFENYRKFEQRFVNYGISDNLLSGVGWDIDTNIGIYCLNTATCASGGIEIGGQKVDDKNRLAINTRDLQKWVINCNARTKILVMHHPIDWLTGWAQEEIKKILYNNFSLCLTGHVHGQSVFYSINKNHPTVECIAPPLLTNKKDNLGYAIISISEIGVLEIQYRQWTKNNSFVTGVNFSDSDDGKVIIQIEQNIKSDKTKDFIGNILFHRLDDALRTFSSQPIVWVEPVISKTNEISRKADDDTDNTINLDEFIANPTSTIIKAPPQFGLTCLAHYIAKEAWNKHNTLCLYLDSKSIKSHNFERAIKKELEILRSDLNDIKCILLDSWTSLEKDSVKLLKNLSESFQNFPIIVFQTIDDSKFASETNNEIIHRHFNVLHLLALPRGHIRKVVSEYNHQKPIGDEDAIITKVTSDLEVLNLHRTPLNCITLLKVSEKYFDESPVNRTKMLEMVLFLLFNMDELPTYKARPDLKDCEYVLGRYCEKMIRTCKYYFTREDFLKELEAFCSEKLIDLEVGVVFDILFMNNIIIKFDTQYCFRFSYWIFYFAAQRMHQDQNFSKYIFEENRYVSFPEIIEFYTGIDRRREDALTILLEDMKNICDTVCNKVGLPEKMNPYRLAQWMPTPKSIEEIQNEIGENVINSKLPDEVKDKYADRNYDQMKPYDQSIHTILNDYSLAILMQSIKASSRALRNSDYVNPDIKRDLLQQIIRAWEQISKIILVLTPILSIRGYAAYDGAGFFLDERFLDNDFSVRLNTLINVIPINIVNWFKNDLFSKKMAPLIYDQISKEENELKKHQLILLLICERPRDWKVRVENYIASISKNSFYLFDVVSTLRDQYRYSFASLRELKEIEYLIKMGLAKHEFGTKKPGLDKIVKISNKNLPIREVDKFD